MYLYMYKGRKGQTITTFIDCDFHLVGKASEHWLRINDVYLYTYLFVYVSLVLYTEMPASPIAAKVHTTAYRKYACYLLYIYIYKRITLKTKL